LNNSATRYIIRPARVSRFLATSFEPKDLRAQKIISPGFLFHFSSDLLVRATNSRAVRLTGHRHSRRKFIDTEKGRELSNQIILIRGGKIEAVGENIKIPEGAKTIDLSK